MSKNILGAVADPCGMHDDADDSFLDRDFRFYL